MRKAAALLLLLAACCSQADAANWRRPRGRGYPTGAGYGPNLNSWDNTTGGAGDYEAFRTSGPWLTGGETEFSVCLWAYDDPATAYRDWLGQWGSSENMWAWQVTNGNLMRVSISNAPTDGSNYQQSTGNPYIAAQWNHFCFTYNAGTVVLYRNGAVLASATTGTIPTSIRADDEELNIGSSQTVANADFGQRVDDILLFRRALSADEVSTLYTVKNPDYLSGIDHWWPMDDANFADAITGEKLTKINGTGNYSLNADTPY